MASVFTIDINGLKEVQQYLSNLELTDIKKQELLEDIGVLVIYQTKERFKSKTSPEGAKWAKWNRKYALKRSNGKSLLEDQGDLKQSIVYKVSSNKLEVGSDEDYAATHQYGDKSIITRKTKNGRSKPFNRNIPARPYLGINAENEKEIEFEIIEYLKEQGY